MSPSPRSSASSSSLGSACPTQVSVSVATPTSGFYRAPTAAAPSPRDVGAGVAGPCERLGDARAARELAEERGREGVARAGDVVPRPRRRRRRRCIPSQAASRAAPTAAHASSRPAASRRAASSGAGAGKRRAAASFASTTGAPPGLARAGGVGATHGASAQASPRPPSPPGRWPETRTASPRAAAGARARSERSPRGRRGSRRRRRAPSRRCLPSMLDMRPHPWAARCARSRRPPASSPTRPATVVRAPSVAAWHAVRADRPRRR